MQKQKKIQKIIDDFHNIYYNGLESSGHIFDQTYWMNTLCQKCPLDLWIYQEMISEIKPDLIVETGTYQGGSALFMAHILDILDHGEIITIDIAEKPNRPVHPRIKYVKGLSSDSDLIDGILKNRPEEKRLIILDSDHRKSHVLSELNLFSPYATIESYIIVEDTNINGHPVYPKFGEGPFEAVEEFVANNKNFIIDEIKEKFLLTFNPRGYLKRIK